MREMFGGWKQTAIILAVAMNGGEMPLEDVLRVNQWLPKELRLPFAALKERGVLEVVHDRVRLSSKMRGRNDLITFVRTLVKAIPSLDTRPRTTNCQSY
jgi:hypothetical protein